MESIETYRRKKILVAEHEDKKFYFLEKLLAHSGLKIERVKYEKELLKMANKGFDLIMTNRKMAKNYLCSGKPGNCTNSVPVIIHSFGDEGNSSFKCCESCTNEYSYINNISSKSDITEEINKCVAL